MARLLHMPEVAASAAEAVLQSWPVAENTSYAAQDVIVTIETEKAVVDVEAESDGVILKALVPEGARVEVGAPIALIGEPGERVADLDALLARLGVTAPRPRDTAGPGAAPVSRPPVPQPPVEVLPGAAAGSRPPADAGPDGSGPRIFTSPLARRMAAEAGIPVEEITGTGPHGRIVRRDVEAAVAARDTRPHSHGVPERPAAGAPQAPAPALPYSDLPHTRMRRAIATRTAESKRSVPHFYLRGTARVDGLLEVRRQLNDGAQVRVSVNDLVVKAVARAHTLVPAMNVIWTEDAVRSFSSVDVAVAVATERGLATPVVRSAEQVSVSSIASTVRDFVERAKNGRLGQAELEGGTITVSNLGMYGTEEFAAIINPPQSAILAVGAARREPVVGKDTIEAGTVMRVTLSVDHRPVDGAVAAEWMREFLTLIENPLRILA
ncbi:2-oxo acid dehydrogenase subunit E2 [Sinosporangium siamense]|uniref:Dihydrolipoamide acetyltransferase component of pyruvate dehydrogenase complex n=1 Tax=Sinosporangium siamense TaxID=1367973 RepID=A0A919RNK7_9ACTN|nr:2-oxo acid dehydrogenase subunit E2 [Sinosporangium siamense]GII97075.1 acetyltransferase component of pyruvate dehydrogenase complex [Sinosporangium siamense]